MTLAVALRPAGFGLPLGSGLADFAGWVRTHRSAVVVAFLLSFAYPVTSLASSLGVATDVTPALIAAGLFRTTVQGLVNGPSFLIAGYVLQRLDLTGWRAALAAFALAGVPAAIHGTLVVATSWSDMLVGIGDARDFLVDSIANTSSMALLFFTHLQHSRAQAAAAERLGAAKAAQRGARRRLAYGQLKAVQARIDPQLLFDMLDAVRRAYVSDPVRAERLLDELVAFLRAALPRLQDASSTVPREAETARALARLHALSADSSVCMAIDLADDALAARFPPGVLLPLLNEALQIRAGTCALTASRRGDDSVVVLTLPAAPSDATVERVRAVLADLYGDAAELAVVAKDDGANAIVKVPYERA
ncbi:MAG: histidine kinase [Caldimonas sp.]